MRFAEDESTRTADDGKIRKGRSSVCIVLRQWKRCKAMPLRADHNLQNSKASHDLSRCTAFPLLYLIMYYCMLYHNRAKYTRGKFVCERCGNRAIGRRSKLGTRTSGGPLRLGSKHARASGGPFRPSAKDTRASAIPFRPGSKHFNQRTKMAQDFRVVRVSQTAAPPPYGVSFSTSHL